MLNCTKCQGQNVIKSGKIKGRQRYKCKTCNYYYTVAQKSDTSSDAERRLALKLYLEGLGFRAIGRILGFSHVAVYQWIKAFGEQVATIRAPKPVGIVELDEMHSYIGHKKKPCWHRIAVDRFGKRFVHAFTGGRGAATGNTFRAKIDSTDVEQVMTDAWLPYERFVPSEKHVQSKVETYTVEGYNSLLRHFLARFRRKSKGYSKSETMMWYSACY